MPGRAAAPPFRSLTTGRKSNANGSAKLSGTAEANSTVTVFDGAAQIGTASANASGNWTFTTANHLSNSVHTFKATATDAAGNTGPTSTSAILGTTGNDTITGGSGA